MQFGVKGIGLACVTTNLFVFTSLLIYTRGVFDMDTFSMKDLTISKYFTFISLGMPCSISLFMEWGVYQINSFVAGNLGIME